MLEFVHRPLLKNCFNAWLFFCLMLTAPAALADDGASVRAVVDQTVVAPGESVQLSVTISNGQGQIDLGSLPDFKVFSRGTSTSMQIINGQTSREETHNYVLLPQKQGRLTIPAIAATVNGRKLFTEPIQIAVTQRPAADQAGTQRDVWVESTISTDRPYVGQQFTYTFSVYQTVQITDATFTPPEFTGFTAKEIKDRGSRRKVINGQEVVVTQIYYVLVPMAPGQTEIEPAVLRAGIVRPDTRRRRRSPFDDFFDDPFFNRGRVETKVLQSQSVAVDVAPLPPLPANATFSGLIGRFSLKADVENRQLKVGDSTTLAITVEGQGNIPDAGPPPLAVPPAFKTYADTPEENVTLSAAGYSGKKVFRTALVPVQPGQVTLPPVHLTYFDTAQNQYRNLSAVLPALNIAPGDQASINPLAVTPGIVTTDKKEVAFTGRDILPLKEGLEALESTRPMTWPLFLVWVCVPVLAFGTLVLVQHLQRQDLSPAARMRARAHKAIKTAAAAPQEDLQAFLTPLYQAVTAAIFCKAGRTGEALTWREAEQLLNDAGADAALVQQAVAQLTTIESSKFSGSTMTAEQRDSLLESTRQVVKRLAP